MIEAHHAHTIRAGDCSASTPECIPITPLLYLLVDNIIFERSPFDSDMTPSEWCLLAEHVMTCAYCAYTIGAILEELDAARRHFGVRKETESDEPFDLNRCGHA